MAGIVIAAMMALVAGGPQVAAAEPSGKQTVLSSEYGKAKSKVAGTFGKSGTVTGTFTPRRFVVRDDQLMAVGKLRATATRGSGKVVGTASDRVRLPVAPAAGTAQGAPAAARTAASCEILHLVLGPLDLDLLGLEIHLDRVVLDIVATPGPGNLLGNLLCAVAGLLDGGLAGLLGEISRILNAILAILRI